MDEATSTLLAAVQSGDAESVREMVTREPALASARGAEGVSALMQAQYRHDLPTVEALRSADPRLDIFEAASLGAVDRTAELLATDPTLAQAWSPDGFTALHFAAFFGGSEVARLLLDAGAPVDVVSQNDFEVAPIHSAVAGVQDVAFLLVERGAQVNVRQRHGWTPLMGAADNGNDALVDVLLRAGADPTLRNDPGQTAADAAAAKGHAELATRLRQLEEAPAQVS